MRKYPEFSRIVDTRGQIQEIQWILGRIKMKPYLVSHSETVELQR